MITDPKILAAIEAYAPTLRIPDGAPIKRRPLLAAFVGNESSWGANQWKARLEKAYSPGGAYFNDTMKTLWDKYGDLAARSWSCVQIMYVVAWELGFRGHPWELFEPNNAIMYMVEYLNRRTFRTWLNAPKHELVAPAMTVEAAGDSYNTGSFRDSNHNPKYEADLRANYDTASAFYGGP